MRNRFTLFNELPEDLQLKVTLELAGLKLPQSAPLSTFFKDVSKEPGSFRQYLKNEFNYDIDTSIPNPEIAYQKLTQLKKNDPIASTYLYPLILGTLPNFPPLYAKACEELDLSEHLRTFYFHEALRLNNFTFAESLAKSLPENQTIQLDLTASIEAAIERQQYELAYQLICLAHYHPENTFSGTTLVDYSHILNLFLINEQPQLAEKLIDEHAVTLREEPHDFVELAINQHYFNFLKKAIIKFGDIISFYRGNIIRTGNIEFIQWVKNYKIIFQNGQEDYLFRLTTLHLNIAIQNSHYTLAHIMLHDWKVHANRDTVEAFVEINDHDLAIALTIELNYNNSIEVQDPNFFIKLSNHAQIQRDDLNAFQQSISSFPPRQPLEMLNEAAHHGSLGIVMSLVEQVSPTVETLFATISGGRIGILIYFFEELPINRRIELSQHQKLSLLNWAANHNHLHIVQYFTETGPMSMRTQATHLTLSTALSNNSKKVADWLVSSDRGEQQIKIDTTILEKAAQADNFSFISNALEEPENKLHLLNLMASNQQIFPDLITYRLYTKDMPFLKRMLQDPDFYSAARNLSVTLKMQVFILAYNKNDLDYLKWLISSECPEFLRIDLNTGHNRYWLASIFDMQKEHEFAKSLISPDGILFKPDITALILDDTYEANLMHLAFAVKHNVFEPDVVTNAINIVAHQLAEHFSDSCVESFENVMVSQITHFLLPDHNDLSFKIN